MTTLTHRLTRAAQAREQAAYERRVAAFGLSALLAPYSQRPVVRIPSQRVGGSES
jgi:hypothetical protein